jgi:hypothetical protein
MEPNAHVVEKDPDPNTHVLGKDRDPKAGLHSIVYKK